MTRCPRLLLPAALLALAVPGSAQVVLQTPADVALPDIWPSGRAAGDLDGDGDTDLVVSCNTFPSKLVSLLGSPTGDLTPGPLDESGPGYYFLQLGFVDGDTDLDLVSFVGGLPGGQTVGLRRGLGDGDFAAPEPIPNSDPLTDLVMADLDADGELDFATSGLTSSVFGWVGGLEVWKGDGLGGFTRTHHHDPGEGGMDVDVGDVDGDGLLDIVMAAINPSQLPSVPDQHLYLHQSGGGAVFAPPVLLPHKGTQVRLVDMDVDGQLDLLSVPLDAASVDLQRGLGAGAFAPAQVLALQADTGGYTTADLDGDGLPDLAVQLTSGELEVLRNEGGLALASGPVLSKAGGHDAPTVTDLDGDGDPDLLLGATDDVARLMVVRNATYGPGAAFEDLGHALAGSEGWPVLVAEGTLDDATPFAFALGNGLPGASAALIVGASRIDAPFKGGTLVPFPGLILGFVPLSAGGELTLSGTWPTLTVGGFDLWFQYWFQDAGAPLGWASTTAVVGHVPL